MDFLSAKRALERADMLRREADVVLEKTRLFEILQPYSRIFLTGSYYLDVMAYPDIDLYIMKISLEQVFSIAAQLARFELVRQVVFEKSDDPVQLPEGLYLKSRVDYGNWGRPWKIDIWSLDERIILEKMAEMQHFQEKITPVLRERNVRYKLSVMTAEKQTPMYSGIYIYKAFIDERMTNYEDVTNYLIHSGIQVGICR